ncbi:MAG: HD-GYP domain-containing protein [Brevinematales bacterium]|nr:HD-GYP domain-containing protein [Brevinematales bacterium]
MAEKEERWLKIELYTSFLYEGMVLHGDLYTELGEKVANAKEPLSKQLIEELKLKGVKKVYYSKPVPKKIKELPEVIKPETLEKGFLVSQEVAKSIEGDKPLPVKDIESTVETFMGEISSSKPEAVLNMLELKEYDEYTYTHSINVSLLSIMFANFLKWDDKKIKDLGVGAILHDMGKILVPKEIINKNGKLSNEEYELVKKHTIYGYEIVKAYKEFNETVQIIPLLHHECYNGTGYPFGLSGEKIDEVAQIVSIADFFDAIVTKRSYKPGYPLWNAFLAIQQNTGTKFIPRLAIEFVNKMPQKLAGEPVLKVGDFVILNTKEIAEIVELSDKSTLKPTVKIYINSKQQKVKFPIVVMLEVDQTRAIEKIIDDEKALEVLKKLSLEFKKDKDKEGVKKEEKNTNDKDITKENNIQNSPNDNPEQKDKNK